jgi:hypothetical protein
MPAVRSATEVLALTSTALVPVKQRCWLQQDSVPDSAAGALIVLAAVVVSLSAGVHCCPVKC